MHSHCYATITNIHLHNFSICKTEILYLLNNNSLFPHLPTPWPLATTILLSVSVIFDHSEVLYVGGIIQYLPFCDWCTSLSLESSKFSDLSEGWFASGSPTTGRSSPLASQLIVEQPPVRAPPQPAWNSLDICSGDQ